MSSVSDPGSSERRWGSRDIDALTSFGKLASIALDNARLIDVAQRGALYDPTTGLPNRELLTDRIAHALAGHRADDTGSIAVVLLGSTGSRSSTRASATLMGDRLLVAVGQRLVRGLRPGDTVARVGGDEFGIIFDPVADADRGAAASPTGSSPSCGSRSRSTAANGSSAHRWASRWRSPAERRPTSCCAKRRSPWSAPRATPTQRHALFEPSMSAQTLERVELESDLRLALERGELRVHYQPIVTLESTEIVGFEALVRWQHPTRGLVPPLAFIPLAEETGLIIPLGRWVLETACRQAAKWRATRSALDDKPLFVSVNLSARQFMQADLVGTSRRSSRRPALTPARSSSRSPRAS